MKMGKGHTECTRWERAIQGVNVGKGHTGVQNLDF